MTTEVLEKLTGGAPLGVATPGQNPPGIREALLIPVTAIVSFPDLVLNAEAPIYYVLLAGDEANYQERTSRDVIGGYYGYELDVQIAGSAVPDLEKIVRQDYVLLLKDFLDQQTLIGSPEQPLQIRAKEENNSRRSYQLRISADGLVPATTHTEDWPAEAIDLTAYANEHTAPGLVQLTAFFAHEVLSLPESEDPVIDENGKAWLFQVAELDAGYAIDVSRDDQGLKYESKIEIDWPGLADPDYFARYREADFILFTQDFHGNQLVFGTLDQPMRCQLQNSNAGSRGRKLTFSGTTYQKPAGFTGTFATGVAPEPPTYSEGMIDFNENDFSSEDFL